MKEQGKSRKVLLPASLRDGLAGTVSEAVAKTLLASTLRPGAAWRGLFADLLTACQMHMILV